MNKQQLQNLIAATKGRFFSSSSAKLMALNVSPVPRTNTSTSFTVGLRSSATPMQSHSSTETRVATVASISLPRLPKRSPSAVVTLSVTDNFEALGLAQCVSERLVAKRFRVHRGYTLEPAP